MKRISTILTLFVFLACKEKKTEMNETEDMQEAKTEMQSPKVEFPGDLQKVFEAHGGLEAWKAYRTLAYTMPKPENSELHTIDLYNRKDKVETGSYVMGFDGEEVWLQDENEAYEGDPVFYHNLMFYFYAMPFVLADDGIIYSDTEDLVFEGKSYPGMGISYSPGVGTSYKDEYFIHFDPETYEMAWLGYTVTYRSGEKSENVKWIRYDDWTQIEDVKLPQSISWYNYEGREIKDARSKVPFESIQLDKYAKPTAFYDMPEGAKMVKGKVQE